MAGVEGLLAHKYTSVGLPAVFYDLMAKIITDVLDGMMVVLAMFTLNFFHPGRLLPHDQTQSDLEEKIMEGSVYRSSE